MIDIKSSEKSFSIAWRNIQKSVIGRPTLRLRYLKIEKVRVSRSSIRTKPSIDLH